MQQPIESPAFFRAAVQYLAERSSGRVMVDPRPLRPGADAAHVEEGNLAADAKATVRLRSNVLAEGGIQVTDAIADFRCTFSAGVSLPPERFATLPDSIQERRRNCRAREPYTSLLVGLPEHAAGDRPAGTWHTEAVAMTLSGYQIWDLYLRVDGNGSWRVVDSGMRLNIRS